MRIAVVAPAPVPLVVGGAERLWWGLVGHFNENTGHRAELIKLPTAEGDLRSLVAAYEEFSRLDLSAYDVVVSGKYPAWMVAHPRHVCYMLHRLRGLYDAYDGAARLPRATAAEPRVAALLAFMDRTAGHRSALPEFFDRARELLAHGAALPGLTDFPGPFARDVVHWLDRIGLAPDAIERYVAISATVARRPGYFPAGVDVRVAWPPAGPAAAAATRGDNFFTASRLDGVKRVDLLVKAMRHVRADIPLLIAGTGPQSEALAALAAGDARVRLLGHCSDREIDARYAEARAVPFVPYDEDYGLVAVEAMRAGKPVVTTEDAGGPCELVVDGVTGIVCTATPAAIGAALERLATDATLAASLGAAARERARDITWDAVVATLLPANSPALPRAPARAARRLVVATTFGIHPPRHGGQVRVFQFYSHLHPDYETTVVSFGPAHGESFDREIAPGLREVRIAKSAEHERRELAAEREVGIPVTDVMMPALSALTPAYAEALAREAAGAHAVIACHPYLYPELAGLGAPLWYEAQDLEWNLKAPALSTSEAGRRLLADVRDVEGRCARAAELVICAAADDAADLTAIYGVDPARVVMAPNGTDCARLAWLSADERAAARSGMALPTQPLALFMGSGHWPNIEAVGHLLRIADELPDVAFVVIGSVCEAFGPSRHANVLFLGEVDDITRNVLLEVCDAALNPMEHGSGTSLKILDFFAAGVPVISTPLGARGTGAVDRVHCILAAPDQFGLALRELLASDPVQRDTRTRAARALVESTFDWATIARSAAAAFTAAGRGRA